MTRYGGKHPNTAALKNVLAAQGVKAPHNGELFNEAMLLAIGGELGADAGRAPECGFITPSQPPPSPRGFPSVTSGGGARIVW